MKIAYLLPFGIALILLGCSQSSSPKNPTYAGPIIDMHIHANTPEELLPEKAGLCPPLSTIIPDYDNREEFANVWIKAMANPSCPDPIWSPESYEEYLERVDQQLKKNQITALASGKLETHESWKSRFGDRIIPSLAFRLGRENFSPDSLKQILQLHKIQVLGEISNQYAGIAPNDPRMDPYYELAQELDIAVGIHMGSGAPGAAYFFDPDYKAAYSHPLLLEDVLKKYPKLRLYVIHYGEPFIDEMITLMYHYPQLYLDLGGIQWCYPKAYFYEYHLKKLVSAGFGKRIMFGSDAFIWPELMDHSISIINEADFLTYEEKADIFYHNARRFLRLDEQVEEASENTAASQINSPAVDSDYIKRMFPDYFSLSEAQFEQFKADPSTYFLSSDGKSRLYFVPYTDYSITTAILVNGELEDREMINLLQSSGIDLHNSGKAIEMPKIESRRGIKLGLSMDEVEEILGKPDILNRSSEGEYGVWNFSMMEEESAALPGGLKPFILEGLAFSIEMDFTAGRLVKVVYRYDVP